MSSERRGHDEDFRIGRREALITRVVDGEATDQEWAEFRAMAEAEVPVDAPCAWRELARAQRDQALMSAVIGDQLAGVEHIDVPTRGLRLVGGGGHAPLGARVMAVGGWVAVAAALLMAWMFGWVGNQAAAPTGTSQAGLLPLPAGAMVVQSPDDAVKAYIEKCKTEGRVVQDVPQRVLVRARPKSGQPDVYEVVYIRQFVETAEIRDLQRLGGRDESGRPRLLPTTPSTVQHVSYGPN